MITKKILLQDILPLDNLKADGKVLLVRHSHDKLDEMQKLNLIDEYQSFQNKSAFRNCKYIVSFLGGERNTGIFYGLFEVIDLFEKKNLPAYSKELEKYCIPQNKEKDFFLRIKKIEKYNKFIDRLIIDWKVPRGWYNTYGDVIDKDVIKIQPLNFVKEFPGLMNVKLNYYELKKIIENPESHSEWYNSLTRLQAVYLILDKKTGFQYVGTTYGVNGLWQRWETYIKTEGTGDNKALINLYNMNPDFNINLQFSILEVLSKTAGIEYCTSKESVWKEKLGSRALFGLNSN